MSRDLPGVERLLAVMAALRDPETGCPWDLKQNFETIVPYTIEEAYEVADAIERASWEDIQDELGDLLFQVIFYAQLGSEAQQFDFDAIAMTAAEKLTRRHPHVFAEKRLDSSEVVATHWEQIKQQEREAKGEIQDQSVLANVPVAMAPLIRAHKLQKKCAKVGFDWPDYQPVVAKVQEELEEVVAEMTADAIDATKVEEEIGDLLFAAVNLARHCQVDAETALRKANRKFEQRFRGVETLAAEQGVVMSQSDPETLEAFWQNVKSKE